MKRKFIVAEKRYVLCDEAGNPITDKVFRNYKENDYFTAVQIGNKWGFVNENGELTIPAIYDYVKFIYNKAIVEANGICTIFDKDCKKIKVLNENNEEIIISEIIEHNFVNDFYFLFKTSDEKWGLCNLDFKPIVYPNYTNIIHNARYLSFSGKKGYIIFYSNEDHKICAYSFDANKSYEYHNCDISTNWLEYEKQSIDTINKYTFIVYKVYTLEDEGNAYLYYDEYIDSFNLVKVPTLNEQDVDIIDLDMTIIFKKDEDLYNKDYDIYNIYVFEYEDKELNCRKIEFPFDTNEIFVRNAYIPFANGRGGRHNDCPYMIIKDANGPCYVVDTLNQFEVKAKLNKFWSAYFFMRFGKHFHKVEF